jgi:hypothetical protein
VLDCCALARIDVILVPHISQDGVLIRLSKLHAEQLQMTGDGVAGAVQNIGTTGDIVELKYIFIE